MSPILMIALVLMTSGILVLSPNVVMAASITSAKDTLTRLATGVDSNHTIVFTTPTGIANGATVTLTFDNSTNTADVVVADVDVADNGTDVVVVSGAPGATEWRFVNTSNTVLTFTLGSGAAVTAGHIITIEIGTNATYNSVTGTNMILNGSTGTTTLSIAAGASDSGAILIPIMDSDQVSITASVNQTMSFDLDVGYTTGENGTPYQVPFGVLSASTVKYSDHSSVKSIFADGGTNASGGMNVTVQNANGAEGLHSSSTTDQIDSTTATMAAGTENYGLCVTTAALTGFSRATAYSTTCTTSSGTNQVVGLTTTPANILTSTAPVDAGHAEIVVNAEVSTATPAHTDYVDTLTFIATATF